ncbi:hypothetical protein GCM10022295_16890 [Streptomyces osmaniensis]|uniref:Uncharacterized protein n=1 Tax=Streptomyces osmaniensis TaxID=593134 RepID=A0ABP6VKN8_9ACTN
MGRVGTLDPPKTLAPIRTRVRTGTFRDGNFRSPGVSRGFPGRSSGRMWGTGILLHRTTSIAQDAGVSTTGEIAGGRSGRSGRMTVRRTLVTLGVRSRPEVAS